VKLTAPKYGLVWATKLRMKYDALGNRVVKENPKRKIKEVYVRDAQGNILALYQVKNDSLYTKEFYMYGSNRLGYFEDEVFLGRKCIGKFCNIIAPTLPLLSSVASKSVDIVFGNKRYELSDWLGNVRVVINDRKTPVNIGATTVGYKAHVVNVSDYYSFGGEIVERTYDPVKPFYRFGFNTQEKTFELNRDHYTAKFWEYDARLGRRWNVDPEPNDGWSLYSVLFDNPLKNIDVLGNKPLDDYKIKSSGKIEKIKTNDNFDRFFYVDEKSGKEKLLGQFEKVVIDNKEMVKLPLDFSTYKFVGNDKSRIFLRPEAAAAFLGAVEDYYDKFQSKIYVTQFSTITGGHSSHYKSGSGDFVDYRYSHIKGNIDEPVYTHSKVFDKEKSQYMVDQLIKFGYNSIPGSMRGNRYSILTEQYNSDGQSLKQPALKHTGYYPGHYHHVHIQNYDFSSIKEIKN
jgi:hypothetical protein